MTVAHAATHTAAVRTARRQGLVLGLSVSLYGTSFGAVSVSSGLSIWQTQVLSLVLFSGGSQFALAGVIGGGGSGISAFTASTLLAARNTFYGLRTARFLGVRGIRRLAAAHVTIDESTAVGSAQEATEAQRAGFWTTGLTIFAGWNLMTLVGALAGNAIGDPKQWGLDAAASAAFCSLLWPRLSGRPARATALLAVAIALGLSPFTAAGIPVIASSAAALAVAVRTPGRRR